MKIKDASENDVRFVVERLRDCDLAKFSALHGRIGRSQMARRLAPRFSLPGMLAFADESGEVIAIGGSLFVRRNVATTGFFATDAWPKIGTKLSRWVRQYYFPELMRSGVHRIEVLTTLTHPDTHRWLAWLGLDIESVKPGFGENGETFVEFSWVDDAYAPGNA